MAVTQLKDGRWICYYLVEGPDGKKTKYKREYFGRGKEAEEAALKRNAELNLKKRRRPAGDIGPSFGELAKVYLDNKPFSNANSYKLLTTRLNTNILPHFQPGVSGINTIKGDVCSKTT